MASLIDKIAHNIDITLLRRLIMNFESRFHSPGFRVSSDQLDRITGISNDFNKRIQRLTQPVLPKTLWSENLLRDFTPKISPIAAVPSIVNSLNLNSIGITAPNIQNVFPSTLGNAFNNSFIDSITHQSSLAMKFNEMAQESFQSHLAIINNWSAIISNTFSNQIFTFDDFRKNVLVHETFNELEEYQNSEVLNEEVIYLKKKVFNLEEQNNQFIKKYQSVKEKLDQQQFENDINSVRIDDLENPAKVSSIIAWFLFTVQFFGVDITYENMKELLDILVLQIKSIVDKP